MKRRVVGFSAIVGLMVLVFAVGILFFSKSGSDSQSSVDYDTSSSEFGSYTYTEQHADKSKMIVVVSEFENTYVALMKYFDTTGAAYFDVNVLSDEQAEKFENGLNDAAFADEDVDDERVYTTGVVEYTSSDGSTMYHVEPLDISGFIKESPWDGDVDTVVGKPECAKLFSEDSLRAAMQPETDTELNAYMDMIYQQVVALTGTDKLDKIEIDGTALVNGVYPVSVSVTGEKDVVNMSVSPSGYVEKIE